MYCATDAIILCTETLHWENYSLLLLTLLLRAHHNWYWTTDLVREKCVRINKDKTTLFWCQTWSRYIINLLHVAYSRHKCPKGQWICNSQSSFLVINRVRTHLLLSLKLVCPELLWGKISFKRDVSLNSLRESSLKKKSYKSYHHLCVIWKKVQMSSKLTAALQEWESLEKDFQQLQVRFYAVTHLIELKLLSHARFDPFDRRVRGIQEHHTKNSQSGFDSQCYWVVLLKLTAEIDSHLFTGLFPMSQMCFQKPLGIWNAIALHSCLGIPMGVHWEIFAFTPHICL